VTGEKTLFHANRASPTDSQATIHVVNGNSAMYLARLIAFFAFL
jgi:hypothetical protein